MQRLGCLVLVLILAVVGYDQWRMEQMRSELQAISNKFNAVSKQTAPSPGKLDMVTALAETQRHTRRAKELIRKKKLAEAQAELDKALASLQSANNVSEDIVGDAAQFMGNAREKAVTVFQKAWKDISEQARPKKIGVEGEKSGTHSEAKD